MWKYLAEKLRYGQRDDPESVGYLARVDGMVKRVREELLKIEKKEARFRARFQRWEFKNENSHREIHVEWPVQSSDDESRSTSYQHSCRHPTEPLMESPNSIVGHG
jgi:hypothetical protein